MSGHFGDRIEDDWVYPGTRVLHWLFRSVFLLVQRHRSRLQRGAWLMWGMYCAQPNDISAFWSYAPSQMILLTLEAKVIALIIKRRQFRNGEAISFLFRKQTIEWVIPYFVGFSVGTVWSALFGGLSFLSLLWVGGRFIVVYFATWLLLVKFLRVEPIIWLSARLDPKEYAFCQEDVIFTNIHDFLLYIFVPVRWACWIGGHTLAGEVWWGVLPLIAAGYVLLNLIRAKSRGQTFMSRHPRLVGGGFVRLSLASGFLPLELLVVFGSCQLACYLAVAVRSFFCSSHRKRSFWKRSLIPDILQPSVLLHFPDDFFSFGGSPLPRLVALQDFLRSQISSSWPLLAWISLWVGLQCFVVQYPLVPVAWSCLAFLSHTSFFPLDSSKSRLFRSMVSLWMIFWGVVVPMVLLYGHSCVLSGEEFVACLVDQVPSKFGGFAAVYRLVLALTILQSMTMPIRRSNVVVVVTCHLGAMFIIGLKYVLRLFNDNLNGMLDDMIWRLRNYSAESSDMDERKSIPEPPTDEGTFPFSHENDAHHTRYADREWNEVDEFVGDDSVLLGVYDETYSEDAGGTGMDMDEDGDGDGDEEDSWDDDSAAGTKSESSSFVDKAQSAAVPEKTTDVNGGSTALGAEHQVQTRQCAVCRRTNAEDGVKLRVCQACRQIRYCSRECQSKDWPIHKAACKEFRRKAESES